MDYKKRFEELYAPESEKVQNPTKKVLSDDAYAITQSVYNLMDLIDRMRTQWL